MLGYTTFVSHSTSLSSAVIGQLKRSHDTQYKSVYVCVCVAMYVYVYTLILYSLLLYMLVKLSDRLPGD